MAQRTPFGAHMRSDNFSFSPTFRPMNHGSYGAVPRQVQEAQDILRKKEEERPDVFRNYEQQGLTDLSRAAIAPLLGVPVDEVVFIPNATTGANTVLRNLKWEQDDVIVHFSTIYEACANTISSLAEVTPVRGVSVILKYPIEDDEVVTKFVEAVVKVRAEGKTVRLGVFDTVLSFPGVRMPWEKLTRACKELGILSLVDGAHGIGNIELTHLGSVSPDFFFSNCHKWLFTPRVCAVFHVPKRNQHLIRTSIPTGYSYHPPSQFGNTSEESAFIETFEDVATTDYSPYHCIPAALKFRSEACGGEETIREYCWGLASSGGTRVAEILGTELMDNQTKTLTKCCFATVRLPLAFKTSGDQDGQTGWDPEAAPKIISWLKDTVVKESDTFLNIRFHGGHLWARLSAQVYLELKDFEWVGERLKDLCDRLLADEKIE